MSVILRKRKNADGSVTLRLDIYNNGVRQIETLKHLKLAKPSNLIDREQNKERLKQAQEIAVARAADLQATNYSMVSDAGKKTIVTAWMQSYINVYTKKDKRNLQGVLNHFINFLADRKKSNLTFVNLSALLIEEFIEYLEDHGTGEGPASYYRRFTKMVRAAYRKHLMKENILDFVERKIKGKAKKKEILTIEEIKVLSGTPIESKEVRRGFLCTCVTGLRWCDIKPLRWRSVDLRNRLVTVLEQSKTEEPVVIPLNDVAIKLFGKPGKPDENVFQLPSANGANKTVKAWVKRAGIEKKITWHNGRHSFGTNLIFADVDLLTTSKLLGHTSVKHTQRYVDTAREMKESATHKLNFEL